jgi:hypothetical protein
MIANPIQDQFIIGHINGSYEGISRHGVNPDDGPIRLLQKAIPGIDIFT